MIDRDIIDPDIAEALREGRPFSTWRLISVLNHQFRELLDDFHNNVLQPHLDWLARMKAQQVADASRRHV